MLLYESGMSRPEHFSCLMEMDRNTSYSLCILMHLSREDTPIVEQYQRSIMQYYAAKGMRGYIPSMTRVLHLSLTGRFFGNQIMQTNLQSLGQSIKELTLPYLDTDSDDKFLVIGFDTTPELMKIRQLIANTFNRVPIEQSAHMTLGKNPPDTPDETITQNPGFKQLTFRGLVVTAMPAAA